jgi:hypothetical protein
MEQLTKHSFLGALCINLSLTCSITAAENSFEAAWNQGFCNALEAFGQEKFKKLGLDDPIEKQRQEKEHRQMLRQEAAEAQRREKQGIFAVRGTKIDECVNLYKRLEQELTWDRWNDFSILDDLKKLYKRQERDTRAGPQVIALTEEYGKVIVEVVGSVRKNQHLNHPQLIHLMWNIISSKWAGNIKGKIKEDVLESMELYKELRGQPHPRWAEFNKMK